MTTRDRPRRGTHRLTRPGASGPAPATRDASSRRGGNGAGLLAAASGLLLLLAAAQGYVSFRAQYAFVDHAKHARLPSVLEALGLDTGAVIFALLALSLARRGRRGTIERVLNVACAVGSLTMNLLAADLTSPRSVTVWVLPSALYGLASDRLIAVVRRWVLTSSHRTLLANENPAWLALGGLGLWALRLIFDPPGTAAGFRRWVLTVAPVAPGIRAGQLTPGGTLTLPAGNSHGGMPGRPGHNGKCGPATPSPRNQPRGRPGPGLGETKREALIRLYEYSGEAGDPRYGNRAKAAALAGEIALQIGYHPGTARRELARYLATAPPPVPQPATEPEPDEEAMA